MTLSRLLMAWVLVAAWSIVSTFLSARLGAGEFSRPLSIWRGAEALLLTLFGSLWFASLGAGEWWLLFLLVGTLAGGAAAFGATRAARQPSRIAWGITADVLRYVIAGAILASRLG